MDSYRNWKLNDPELNREEAWPLSLFPDSEDHYFSESGCAVCSLAIMLRHFGIEPETDPGKFNPWILNQRLIKCRAFDSEGDLFFSDIINLYPLEYTGKIQYSREKLVEVYNTGEPFLLVVLSSTPRRHFIVPDLLTEDDLKIIDCGIDNNEYLSQFEDVFEIRTFRRIDKIIDPTPMVALSFDDGPDDKGISDRIVDTLIEHNVKATFFEIGENVFANPDNLRKKIQFGFEIGTHSWDHDYYGDELTEENMEKGYQAIIDVTGSPPSCFRSPGGFIFPHIVDFCLKHVLPSYNWSIDTRDWEIKDAAHIFDEIMHNVKNGDIILMHELYESTADALERVIPALKKEGFKLVTCSELIRLKTASDPQPGVTYLSSYMKYNNHNS